MIKQPEALRLAVQLEREWINDALNYDTAQDAWTELRRLHEVNQELLEALTKLYLTCDWNTDDGLEASQKASAAIAKAGEQP